MGPEVVNPSLPYTYDAFWTVVFVVLATVVVIALRQINTSGVHVRRSANGMGGRSGARAPGWNGRLVRIRREDG